MQKNLLKSLIRYFKNPLAGISESTAYRLPNSLVHLPIILMLPYLGIIICGTEGKYLLPVYFAIALYTGRDLSIMAYKIKLIPAMVWGAFVPFIVYKERVASYMAFQDVQVSAFVTLVVACVFFLYVYSFVKSYFK